MKVRFATKADADAWLAMRAALWPDANVDALRLEVGRYFVAYGQPPLPHCVFVAEAGGRIVGMLELPLRAYADGCDSSPVPFIEAWYVAEDARPLRRRRAGAGRGRMGARQRLLRDGVRRAARECGARARTRHSASRKWSGRSGSARRSDHSICRSWSDLARP
jgi:aminoglycoside 6'-N-acetyltransferase I